tara:strand:- start:5 stop:217 length:213 start_codon:yes stop_codon:yes gene_type:complete
MTQNVKFNTAVNTLKSDVQMTWSGEINTEEDFNKVQWIIDKDSNDTAITTATNPHSEITWTLVKAEMDKL